MTRIVVVLQTPINRDDLQIYVEEPVDAVCTLPQALDPKEVDTLRLLDASWADRDSDKPIGLALYNLLMNHPTMKGRAEPLLDVNQTEAAPLYLIFRRNKPGPWDIENLHWESIFSPNVGFLSQDRKFSIARAQRTETHKEDGIFVPPLRVMAICGAGGSMGTAVSARRQWEGLRDALARFGATEKLLYILSCEEGLVDDINANGPAWASAEKLLERGAMFERIQDFKPHVLHFFCHGTAELTPRLNVATWATWNGGREDGIIFHAQDLAQMTGIGNHTWLVTLNCCQSAQAGSDAGSLSQAFSRTLVAAGVPAVVGMREQIAADVAHEFCHSFYRVLLEDFQQRLGDARMSNTAEVHWACGLFAARNALFHSKDGREWTAPILQTRLTPFKLCAVPAGSSDEVAALQQLTADRNLLRAMPPGALADIDRTISDMSQRLGLRTKESAK